MDLTPFHLSLIRDALGQAGSEQGSMLAGGLRLGAVDMPAGAGDIVMDGSIRQSTPIGAALSMTAAQSIPDSTWTLAVMDTVRWDNDSMANLAAYAARLTVKTPGVYLVVARAEWPANAAGIRLAKIVLNGTYEITKSSSDVVAGQIAHSMCAGLWLAGQRDYFDLMFYQSSGAPLSLSSIAANRPDFAAVRIA